MPENEADTQKPVGAAQTGGDSAPQQQGGESGGQVESIQAGGRADAPDWFKVEIAKAREKKRTAESKVEELSQEVAKLREQLSKPVGNTGGGSDEVPSAPTIDMEKLKAELLAQVRQENQQQSEQSRVEQEWAKAGEYLRTRPEIVEDPAFRDEVTREVDSDPGLTSLTEKNPMLAAEMAYARVCARKGIAPSIGAPRGGGLSSAAQSFGPGVSGAAGGGGRKREVSAKAYESMLDGVDLNDPEQRKKLRQSLEQLG